MSEFVSALVGIDYQAVFDASPDASFILNSLGQILFANLTAIHRYGFSLEELQHMDIADLVAPDAKAEGPIKLNLPLKTGEIYEWRFRFKNGDELPVEIFLEPIIFHGNPVYLSRVRDVTRRKNLESELQTKRHLLNRILDAEPGTVYIYDLTEQQNVYINRHLLSAFGYTPEQTEVIGPELSQSIHPDDQPNIAANHKKWRSASDGDISSIEYRIEHAEGGWGWLMSRETPYARDEGGKVSQILGIAYDITERKRAETLLEGQKQLLEKVSSGIPLSEILTELIGFIESQSPGMLGSILLLDDDGVHVRHGAAPSLPAEFIAAVDGQPIGPIAGSCGTAAYRKEAVYVEDIATDPLWENYKAAALPHGLRASWSTPIFDTQGQVLGTFAMYYPQMGLPKQEHLRLIDTATHIAAIAISHHRKEEALHESEARYRQLFEYAPDGIAISDLAGDYHDANASMCRMLGYTRDEMLELNAADIVAPTEIQHIEPARDAIEARADYQREWQFRRKDGSVLAAEVKATMMPDGKVLGVISDITERKSAEAKVQRLTQLYAALSQCNQAIVRCSNETELLPIICQDAVKFGGMKMAWIGMIDQNNNMVRPVASFGAGTEFLEGIEISTDEMYSTGRGPTGTAIREKKPIWCQDFQHDPSLAAWRERAEKFGWGAVASLPLYRNGAVIGSFILYAGEANAFDESAQILLVEMAMDISFALNRFDNENQRRQAEEKVQYLAYYDSLTGLANRRLLMDRLHQALVSSELTGRSGALLLIDLDNFKSLNDNLGHHVGDLYLQQTAQRLIACVRDGDTVARLGGDEFVVLLKNLSEQPIEAAEQTEAIGEKMLVSLSQSNRLETHAYHGTTSIGATLFTGHMLAKDELMKQADIAMYQAKKAGRNTVRFFNEKMQEIITGRFSLEGELRKALENQQFQLYYQIQVDSVNRPLGAEVLIRWNHPERGLVPPMQFIPLAEETGLILPIGLWVLETACKQIRAWQEEASTMELVLAVNVSARQFYQSDFVTQVENAVQRHGIIPRLLKLELTEGMLLVNIEETIEVMNTLKKIGIQFSLDDFGTGYSSLQYLKQLPLDQIKIDQSFVHDIASDPNDAAIVETIIAMADTMGFNVIAEGVETEAQREFLELRGCTHYQGYLFGRPMPIAQFEALLKRG
jgi:diguanylate cyclase (GGDEF)-like protein/PAS domain S-box-containing protein